MTTMTRLVAGAGSNYARMITALMTTAVLMPAMLTTLGARALGTWQVLFSVCGLLALLDCGLATTLVRVTAQASARDDHLLRNQAITTLTALLAIAGVIGGVLARPLFALLVPTADLAIAERADVASALALLVVRTVVLGLPLSVFRGALVGGHELPAANAIQAVCQVGYTATMLAALAAHPSLTALAGINLLWMLVEHAAYARACARRLPGFALRPGLFAPALVRPLASSGARQLVINTAALVQLRLDVVLVTRWIGLEAAGRYGIALRIVENLFLLIKQGVNAAAPHVAACTALGRKSELATTLVYLSRYATASAMLAAVPLWISGSTLLSLWLGAEGARAAPILAVLLTATVISAALSSASLTLGMGGDEGRLAAIAALSTLANLAASAALSGPAGDRGVALGTLVALVLVELPGLVPLACRRAGVPVGTFVRHALAPALAAGCVQLALTAPLTRTPAGPLVHAACHLTAGLAGLAVLALHATDAERRAAHRALDRIASTLTWTRWLAWR